MLSLPPSSLLAPRLSIYNISAWNCYATSVFDSVNYEIELQDICNLVRDNGHLNVLSHGYPKMPDLELSSLNIATVRYSPIFLFSITCTCESTERYLAMPS